MLIHERTRNVFFRWKNSSPSNPSAPLILKSSSTKRHELGTKRLYDNGCFYTLLINIRDFGSRSACRVRDWSGILWRRRRWRRRKRYSGKPDGFAGTHMKYSEIKKFRNSERCGDIHEKVGPRKVYPRKGTKLARKGGSTKGHEMFSRWKNSSPSNPSAPLILNSFIH